MDRKQEIGGIWISVNILYHNIQGPEDKVVQHEHTPQSLQSVSASRSGLGPDSL